MTETELFAGYIPSQAGSRPTARPLEVDLSREAARASGTYPAWDGAMPRPEPCVCGGVIVADRPSWQSVLAAVKRHQASDLHAVWRAKEGL